MDYSYAEKKLKAKLPTQVIWTGVIIVILGFSALFIIAYLLKYSDKVVGTITVATAQLPLDQVAQTDGTLVLLTADQAIVEQDQRIAYIKSAATYEDVLKVAEHLTNEAAPIEQARSILRRKDWAIGDLSQQLTQLEAAVDQYDNFRKSNQQMALIAKKKRNIRLYKERLQLLTNKSALSAQDIQLAEKQSESKQSLAEQEIIAEAEFERAIQEKISKELLQLGNAESINAVEIYITGLEEEIIVLGRDLKENTKRLEDQIKYAVSNFREAIQAWEDQHLILAGREGLCVWSDYLTSGSYIQRGQKICTIVPDQVVQQVGNMKIAMNGASKVKKGQTVNIFLANYPANEFGILKGEVSSIAPLPEDGIFKIGVALPDTLESTYGIPFDFQQLATGQAEIITNKMSFVERIWNEAKGWRLNDN